MDDYLNLKQRRNYNNMRKLQYDYNCGGYALGTFSWYLPFSKEESEYYDEEFFFIDTTEVTAVRLEKCASYIVSEIPWARRIQTIEECDQDEYAVAFRFGGGDFHFLRQLKGDVWKGKSGALGFTIYSQESVFRSDWNCRYNSPIVLFACKYRGCEEIMLDNCA